LKKSVLIVGLLVVGGSSLPVADVADAEAASIGASVGYGTAGGSPNAYGLGVLGRVGFTFPFDVYLGANFVYHFGSSTDGVLTPKVKKKVWYAGGEFGYVLGTKHWQVRPYLGFGGIVLNTHWCDGDVCHDPSNTAFYFAPGVYGQYNFGPMYLGADIRYMAAPNAEIPNSFGFFGSVGVNF